MQWSAQDLPDRSVIIPDSLINSIIAVVDVPPASLPLDPYQDYRISSQRVREVIENLRKAISERCQVHLQQVLRQLNLRQWEAWAEGLLKSTEQQDELLVTLRNLEDLCQYAIAVGKDIQVIGD